MSRRKFILCSKRFLLVLFFAVVSCQSVLRKSRCMINSEAYVHYVSLFIIQRVPSFNPKLLLELHKMVPHLKTLQRFTLQNVCVPARVLLLTSFVVFR